mmetsp:Transcript_102466/g.260218  ORF Transcript_102466/g.260218 Transcript_102466/m.260218 type:complete len:254 (+) Transcript_102466:1044-1805(+)
MVLVEVGHCIRMVRARFAASLNEESVVRIEAFPRQSGVPLLAHAASIDALFVLELNLDLRPHFFARSLAQLVVRVHEDLAPAHPQTNRLVPTLHAPRAQLRPEVCTLVVEVQAHGHVLQQRVEGLRQQAWGLLDQGVQWPAMPLAELPQARLLDERDLVDLLEDLRSCCNRCPRCDLCLLLVFRLFLVLFILLVLLSFLRAIMQDKECLNQGQESVEQRLWRRRLHVGCKVCLGLLRQSGSRLRSHCRRRHAQ